MALAVFTLLCRPLPASTKSPGLLWRAAHRRRAHAAPLLALVWGGSTHPWVSPIIIWLFAPFAIVLYYFIREERYFAEDPVLPMYFFKNRAFVTSVAAVFLTAIGMFGSIVYLPLFAQTCLAHRQPARGLYSRP
jgi:hypothetical protein